MEIEGPLKFRIVTFDNSEDREVHVDFKQEFQDLDVQGQADVFLKHISSLHSQVAALNKEDEKERQGMLMVLKLLEELWPHVKAGEVSLDETIVGKVEAPSPLDQLISGLKLN
ncbi:MAG: transcriptional regulator [Gammaproteobacteria bacterium]|nr:MAG: transcriptional regulator [Gammaproteobacteria bacterium]